MSLRNAPDASLAREMSLSIRGHESSLRSVRLSQSSRIESARLERCNAWMDPRGERCRGLRDVGTPAPNRRFGAVGAPPPGGVRVRLAAPWSPGAVVLKTLFGTVSVGASCMLLKDFDVLVSR